LKKLAYILFAVVFTVLTVGISISRHYSGGELYSFALYGEADSCCEIPSDCCDNELDVIQFTADYVFSSSTEQDNTNIAIDLFADSSIHLLQQVKGVDEVVRLVYPIDFHPPRETTSYLSQIQSYRL
jgi:hypothetical protein